MSKLESVEAIVEKLRDELAKLLIGQQGLVDRLLIGLLAGGHVLLEGMPGLAKTLAARALAGAIGATFRRVQFTPDLLPADLVGTEVCNPASGQFTVRQGPIFTQILLADEINRAPAKVQSALLEAMQERQVTLGGQTFPLPELFWVLATQNPIEQEGTYPLPEAQVDRFLMKVVVEYPERDEERRIVERMAFTSVPAPASAVVEPAAVLEMRRQVDQVHVESSIIDYAIDLVRATRKPSAFGLPLDAYVQLGASPRAAIALVLCAKAGALLAGRDYVVPHDVKSIAHDVLRHRLLVTFEAEAENITPDGVLDRLLAELPVP